MSGDPLPTGDVSSCTVESADFIVQRGGDVFGQRAVPVCVERGPTWLAQLVYAPPDWLPGAIGLVIVASVALAGLGYHRHGINEDVLEEMSENVTIAVCVLIVGGVTSTLTLPYWALVIVTAVGGIALAKLAHRVISSVFDRGDSSSQSI